MQFLGNHLLQSCYSQSDFFMCNLNDLYILCSSAAGHLTMAVYKKILKNIVGECSLHTPERRLQHWPAAQKQKMMQKRCLQSALPFGDARPDWDEEGRAQTMLSWSEREEVWCAASSADMGEGDPRWPLALACGAHLATRFVIADVSRNIYFSVVLETLKWQWKITCLETWPSSSIGVGKYHHFRSAPFVIPGVCKHWCSCKRSRASCRSTYLVHWSPCRTEPTCHQQVLRQTVCSVINNILVVQKGLGCLEWICATRVTGQTVQPGFAGGLHFRSAICRY